MERESFTSLPIAKLLNDNFVSIKVDKEERGDVDRVYMTYVQATSGSGGWPMSVFLTPELRPFLGGTYFPPADAYGRPGFATLLRRIAEVWRDKKDLLRQQSAETMDQLAEATQSKAEGRTFEASQAAKAIQACTNQLEERFDAQRGGFGGAPKFPRPAEINLLHAAHLRDSASDRATSSSGASTSGTSTALRMAEKTLQSMAAGGVYDHVGGGFHRYSVDEHWHVPHFEKMLYDNGQLASTYLDAFCLTGKASYARVARGILDYLKRDMTHPDGGIFSAEDADSIDKAGKKTEGAYYVWTAQEVDEVLGTDTELGRAFKQHYYVKANGNVDLSPRSDPHGEFQGLNCFIERESVEATASALGLSVDEAEQTLAKARELLHARRLERPRPHVDDKIVAAWNGLAMGALAKASRVLANEPDQPPRQLFPVTGRPAHEYLDDAKQIARFVRANLWDEQRQRLLRSFLNGPSDVEGFADDYAFVISGLLDLYSASGETQWLAFAQQLQQKQDELFWDDTAGGYYATTGNDPSILLRMKEDYDGAEPAASSYALSNLLRLAALAGPEDAQWLRERAERTAAAFQERLGELAMAMPQMCAALHLLDAGHFRQVIIAGKAGAPDTEALMDAAHASFAPDKTVMLIDPTDEASTSFWREHNPEALAMAEGWKTDRPATAYVCQNFTCKAPTTDPQKLRASLAESQQPPSTKPLTQQIDLSGLTTKTAENST
ncbi:g85 [Coccomyxa viridis]|uniref:G85 protein n=1 Tax=Coccomyxa viridis TaxID=1274662 RepID=A0ABP1FEW0_9CHLO